MDVLVDGAFAKGLSLGISLCLRRLAYIDFSSLHEGLFSLSFRLRLLGIEPCPVRAFSISFRNGLESLMIAFLSFEEVESFSLYD